jgi:hypothetical protein
LRDHIIKSVFRNNSEGKALYRIIKSDTNCVQDSLGEVFIEGPRVEAGVRDLPEIVRRLVDIKGVVARVPPGYKRYDVPYKLK